MPKTLGDHRHDALVRYLIEKRGEAGLKQVELAGRMKVYQSFIARLESGQRRVDVVELVKLGEVLGFDGAILRLGTGAGEVSLDYSRVTCAGAACPDPATYVPGWRLIGSPRLAEVVVPALIEGYARDTGRSVERTDDGAGGVTYMLVGEEGPVARFDILPALPAEAFAALAADEADAVLSTREITPDEVEELRAAGRGRLSDPGRSRILGYDALIPVASPIAETDAITLTELAAILAGAAVDGAEIGLAPGPLTLHLGPEGGGHVGAARLRLLGPGGTIAAPRVVFHADWAALDAAVAADPSAVGLTVFGKPTLATPLSLTGACGRLGRASAETLKTEDYPLTLPLFLYLPARRLPPEFSDWLGWLRGGEAQLILRRAGLVDQAPYAIPVARQGDRLAYAIAAAGEDIGLSDLRGLAEALLTHDRLSLTFRFEVGSTRLDAQSRSNVLQLARGLRDGVWRGAQLRLVGFSDARGPAEANRDLALARADAVRREVIAALGGELPPGVSLDLLAFGEALPMGCDDSEIGRQINRRVELWIARD